MGEKLMAEVADLLQTARRGEENSSLTGERLGGLSAENV